MGFFRKAGPRKKKATDSVPRLFKIKRPESKPVTPTPRGPLRIKESVRNKPPLLKKINPKFRPPRTMPGGKIKAKISESRMGGEPIRKPAVKVLRRKWRPSVGKPEGITLFGPDNIPAGVESIIDIDPANGGFYKLDKATAHTPDHKHNSFLDYWECNHSRNASSWVASIALVVLEAGGLGLMAQFWDGAVIAYVWDDDDTTIKFYEDWKTQPSKGKYIRGRFGPSVLWNQPYVRLASGK